MKKFFIVALAVCISSSAFSQTGFLRGKVYDQISGEALFGAAVIKKGTTTGAVADFDGNFSLTLEPGTHTIEVQFVSYQSKTIEGVEIVAGQTTTLDIPISEDVTELESVVVTAEVIRNNDVGLLSVQKKSINTMDGISSASFRRVGDSNLSSAMNRVTGVTIQGDKYVYVRGLGDRYTKTSLNGMIIPGLDPDRNDVQVDLFPTGVLENVIVYKTFTPNLVGDFAGGLVNIQTKAFPEEQTSSASLSFGYNPAMHFNSNAVSYKGSSTDALGWDNGARALPISASASIPTLPNSFVEETTKKFSPLLGTSRSTNFMNTNFSLSHGNQVQRNKVTWGYNAIFNYTNTNTFYEGFTRKRFEKDRTSAEVSLERDFTAVGDLSSNNVLWSALGTLAAKVDNHTIGTNIFRTQNGVSTALDREIDFTTLNNPTHIHNDILAYTQRQMTNNILYGKHQFGRLRVDWTNSLLFSGITDPDYRDTRINEDDDTYAFRNGGGIDRFWRELKETNESFKADLTYDLNDNNKLKAGAMVALKWREFKVNAYNYDPLEAFQIEQNDANWLLTDANLYSAENPRGLYVQNNSNAYNNYDGSQSTYAAYVMNEMNITSKLKSIYGVRVENVKMFYTGIRLNEDNSSQLEENTKTLDKTNLLPSLNFVYALQENMNLRASFNKTLARPSFKEKSSAFIEDPITRIQFSGNLDLKQAQILNYDLRWEYFFTPGEMVSASVFYKDFTDHIALVFFPNNPGQLKPRNVGEAQVYGAEFEVRKDLSFITPALQNFSIGSNVSIVASRVNRKTVTVSEQGQTEYDSEVSYKGGDASSVKLYREMTGQSPYVVNAYLLYQNDEIGFSTNLSYNVQGETITFIGISNIPDVYQKPFNSLNLNVTQQFGGSRQSALSFTAKNLLNAKDQQVYKFGNEEELFSLYMPQRLFSLKYTYTF
ncbi:TonB-dependent receptor [uncultured Imperialibacter sp.]|uniref:TonB-dependent receptor n=1 Tax=uncultured Imperialibacter sp. TaxID=1672639 RepID=UPI0030DA2342|tara:strand:- start:49571 stop:52381 length:2811 start_codon:yes stop_codon:yes gene_type:complete